MKENQIKKLGNYHFVGKTLGKGHFGFVELAVHTLTNIKVQTVIERQALAVYRLLVRQLEADILTISRGNSILVLSCFFKVGKYISECRPR